MSTPDPVRTAGQGSTLAYSIKGTSNFTTLGEITAITPGSITTGEAECTTLASDFKDYIPTIAEGEAGFKLNVLRNDSSAYTFRDLILTPPVPIMTFKVTYPDTSTDTFDGFCKSWEPEDISNEAVMNASIKIRMKSRPAHTAAASN